LKNLLFIILAGWTLSAKAVLFCSTVHGTLAEVDAATLPAAQSFQTLLATPRLLMGRYLSSTDKTLVILDRETLQPVGSIAIRVFGSSAHIPIYMDRIMSRFRTDQYVERKTGKGLGTEAKYAAMLYAFDHLGVENIYARILEKNIPSLALHRKFGFSEVAEQEVPERFRIPLEHRDGPLLYFALSKAKFFELEAARKANPKEYEDFFDPSSRLISFGVKKTLPGYEFALREIQLGLLAEIERSDVGREILKEKNPTRLEQAMAGLSVQVQQRLSSLDEEYPDPASRKAEYHLRENAIVATLGDLQLYLILRDRFMKRFDDTSATSLHKLLEDFQSRQTCFNALAFSQLRGRSRELQKLLKPHLIDSVAYRRTIAPWELLDEQP